MKRKNYYQVHKNKKRRKLVDTRLKALKIMMRVILPAINRFQQALKRCQPIPKYKLGSDQSNAYQVISNNEQPEIILDRKGDKVFLGDANNFGRNPKNPGNYKEVSEALRHAVNLTALNAVDLSSNPFSPPLKQMVASGTYDGAGYSEDYDEYLKRKATKSN